VLYAPQFQLRAFERLSDGRRIRALERLLEALCDVNAEWLMENANAPWLYRSGVRYEEEPPGRDDWQDIPETLMRRGGDCEDLACWRIAELRVRLGEHVKPVVKRTLYGPRTVYHVAVMRADGRLEDPSRILGMP
jgi:hypothetical protein